MATASAERRRISETLTSKYDRQIKKRWDSDRYTL